MSHKLVKYRLTSAGTIPTWLKFKVKETTHGMFPVFDSDTPSPQDWIMIGITNENGDISNAIEEITTKENLTSYLTHIKDTINCTQTWENTTPAEAAEKIWNNLVTLNQ
tara:strand:+ start:9748 stop:10074 length:327 start_codon:yes stop_codon:yes gene_type:complete